MRYTDDERDRAAVARDAAAARRDAVAGAREAAASEASAAATAVTEQAVQAAENAATVLTEQERALHAAAELVSQKAATARDAAGVLAEQAESAAADRAAAAADRAAAAADREEAALDRFDATQALTHAYRDDLTGALLRDAGWDQLTRAVDRAHRGEPLTIAFIDVDGLKAVNDEQGHAAGDQLLRAVGAALCSGLRSYDSIVRYGGDEFICALTGVTEADATPRLQAMQTQLATDHPGASISIGLAQLTTPGETLEDVIDRADRAMYHHREHARRPNQATPN